MPRTIGDWTRDKLKVLEDYLPAYLGATTPALERIYVDGFAGPGTNILQGQDRVIDGSPLIALSARAVSGTRFSRLYFIEKDPDLAAELERSVAERGESSRVTVICGDANVELPKAVQAHHKRAPIFVFLDPQGIDPRWDTIQAIAQWKTELLINFPFGMAINRNLQSPKVTAYFGNDEWQQFWRLSGRTPIRELLDHYKKGLVSLGYKYTTADDRLIKTQGNKPLYYLIFVSQVDIGPRIMNSVLRQPDARGQARLF